MSEHKRTIPKAKIELVKRISSELKKHRTVLIASCKSLPSSQFHAIKKKLRGTAEIIMAKKRTLVRAIDNAEKGTLQNLKKDINADFAVFFTEVEPFEFAGMLIENQVPTKAKAGDIAPEDLEIQPGPTDLVPGPAISELSNIGLKVAVKEGKLEIIKGAIVAKKGQPVSDKVAAVLGKLGVTPMKVGFIPIAAYDAKSDAVYSDIKIDKEGALNELREMIQKALGFAVKMDYSKKETISYFIAKAGSHEKALEKLVNKDKEVA